jgi:hypothetical protein
MYQCTKFGVIDEENDYQYKYYVRFELCVTVTSKSKRVINVLLRMYKCSMFGVNQANEGDSIS